MGRLTDIVDAKLATAVAEQKLADARSKSNWEYRQGVLRDSSAIQAGLVTQGIAAKVNKQSIINGTKDWMEQLANAKIRLGTADGPYEGSEWDEKFVQNSQADIAGIADTFGSFLFVDEKYKETMMAKGEGNAEGMIDMSTADTFFLIGQNIADPNTRTEGMVSWEREYSEEGGTEWFRVTEGPEVEAEFKRLYAATKDKKYLDENGNILTKHKTSYTKNKNALDNTNGNEYQMGTQFGIVPGLSKMNADLQAINVIGTDNVVKKDMFEELQTTSGLTAFKTKVPRYNDIKNNLKSFVNAEVSMIAGALDDNTGVSFLNSASAELAGMKTGEDGMLEMLLPVTDVNGDYIIKNGVIQMQDTPTKFGTPGAGKGRYVREYSKENSTTKGYSQQEWDNLKKGYLWIKMNDIKATRPGKAEIDITATAENRRKYNEANPTPSSGSGKLTEKQQTKIYNKQQIDSFYGGLESKLGDIKSTDYKSLKNLQDQLNGEISRLAGADNGTFSFEIQQPGYGIPAKLVINKLEGGTMTQEGEFELGSKDIDRNFAEMLDRIFVKEIVDVDQPTGIPFINPGGPYSGTPTQSTGSNTYSKYNTK